MLYVIYRGGVPGYIGGQEAVAHLVLSVKDIARPGDFVITNGHAATPLTQQYDDLARLDQVDWPFHLPNRCERNRSVDENSACRLVVVRRDWYYWNGVDRS